MNMSGVEQGRKGAELKCQIDEEIVHVGVENKQSEESRDGLNTDENVIGYAKDTKKHGCGHRHKRGVKRLTKFILLLLYIGYYGYAMVYSLWDEQSTRLTVLTGCVLAYISWNKAFEHDSIKRKWTSFLHCIRSIYSYGRRPKVIQWFLYVAMAAVFVSFLIINVILKEPSKLISLAGIFVFILILFVYSNNRKKVNWHCVFWGMALQCLLGYFVIKSHAGRSFIMWFSNCLSAFITFANKGSEFVFGASFKEHKFLMQIIPTIIIFCTAINVLIYLGAIQFIVRTFGKLLAIALNVSAPEAINACANVILGGVESTILVKEYVETMPSSRIFALITNWFATCNGSVLLLVMSFGVPLQYLLAASAMSAPAALACAKLAYPDGEMNKFDNETQSEKEEMDIEEDSNAVLNESTNGPCDTVVNIHNENGTPSASPQSTAKKRNKASSIWEAITNGTQLGMKVGANITVVLIVYLALIEFSNKTIEWFGDRVNIQISLNIILGYLFYAFVYLIGVDGEDCLRAGNLLGIKILSAPGAAYAYLGKIIDNRHHLEAYIVSFNQTITYNRGDDIYLPDLNETLVGGVFSERSELITSYALCGMASLPVVGIAIGTLSALCPETATEISRMSFRALVTGTIASLLTACIAGLVA